MTQTIPNSDTYALKSSKVTDISALDIPYQRPTPHHYRPHILVIGTGSNVAGHQAPIAKDDGM